MVPGLSGTHMQSHKVTESYVDPSNPTLAHIFQYSDRTMFGYAYSVRNTATEQCLDMHIVWVGFLPKDTLHGLAAVQAKQGQTSSL